MTSVLAAACATAASAQPQVDRTLLVNGDKVAQGLIEHTQAGLFSADETADVGIDLGTPVVEAIGAEAMSRFSGRIPKVTVEVR